MVRRLALFLLLVIAAAATAHDALANPARIIILRHGEKGDAYRLCDVGVQRSLALAGRYLGRGAEASLFAGGEPDAFFVITLHTLELASPAATTWRKPLIMYSVLPRRGQSAADTTRALNERTREATADVLSKWSGKTVVMVWEHHHIADAALEASFPDQKVTLRQLLNLDAVEPKTTVPKTWPGDLRLFLDRRLQRRIAPPRPLRDDQADLRGALCAAAVERLGRDERAAERLPELGGPANSAPPSPGGGGSPA